MKFLRIDKTHLREKCNAYLLRTTLVSFDSQCQYAETSIVQRLRATSAFTSELPLTIMIVDPFRGIVYIATT